MKYNDEIDFVARHYRRGVFSTKSALMRMGIAGVRRRRTWRIAASVAVVMALSATAAILLHHENSITEPRPMPDTELQAPVAAVKMLDFEGAALPTVIAEIQSSFGVRIGGAPANAATLKLTLHYQGDIETLITTINEILGTELYIEESGAK